MVHAVCRNLYDSMGDLRKGDNQPQNSGVDYIYSVTDCSFIWCDPKYR